jgi:hypothetical protein
MVVNGVAARTLFWSFSTLALAACGGGGDGGTPTAPVTSTNRAPTISGAPSASVQVGQPYSFKPSAADADGDPLTFAVANKPAWMLFNAQTGELSGTPTDANVGSYPGIAITVSDGRASASTSSFSLGVVRGALVSATLSWTLPTQNADGTTLANLRGFRVLYGRSAGNLDQSITLDNPSINTYVVDNLASGTWFFAVVSVNAAGTESQATNVVSASI